MLVTHQLQYLKGTEHIVIMSAGQIKAQGTYDYIRSNENDFSMFYDFKKSIESDIVDDYNNESKSYEVRKKILEIIMISLKLGTKKIYFVLNNFSLNLLIHRRRKMRSKVSQKRVNKMERSQCPFIRTTLML